MNNKYHFIAVGGVGMSGLAKYLLQEGFEVSGSDISKSKYTEQLEKLGAKIVIGHSPDNVPDSSVIVKSSAIKDDNPEVIKAKELGLTIYHRSDILKSISDSDKNFIGFSGTHGKTTTSGMCSYLLSKAGLNPSFVVGGIIPEYNTNAEFSAKGKDFVAELDESDGTITKYNPDILVINNLEADHLDHYTNGLKDILYTFDELLIKRLKNSKIIVNIDDDGVKQLDNVKTFITYGLDNADYTAKNITYSYGYTNFDIYYKNKFLTNAKISLPGTHNVYNSLAVMAAIHQSGYDDMEYIASFLPDFTGMGRRFQKVKEFGSITVYDDYAHHPTEIKSTLLAMKSFTDKQVIAVFQPHRYSRLKSLWNDFKNVLNNALSEKDRLIITDIYAASEDAIDGITSEKFASEIKNCEYIPGSIGDVAEKLASTIKENTVIIGLGAGTITTLGKELEKFMKKV